MRVSLPAVRRPWLVGVIGVVMAVVFGFMAVATYHDVTRLRDHGVETTARVVEVEGRNRWTTVVVEYAAAGGERVRASTRDVVHTPAPSPGDRLRVVYDPANPALVADVRARPGLDVPVFGLVMTLLWLALAAFAGAGLVRRSRERREPVGD